MPVGRPDKIARVALFTAVVGGLAALCTTSALRVTALYDGNAPSAEPALLENDGGEVRNGALVLTDDDDAMALFTTAEMLPGHPQAACTTLTYTSTVAPTMIRLHASSEGRLARYLDIVVEVGVGGSFGDCEGFDATATIFIGTLGDLVATHFDGATSLPTFLAVTSPTVRTVRFTVDVQDDPAAQGATTSAGFTWHTRRIDEDSAVLVDAWGDEIPLADGDRDRLQL